MVLMIGLASVAQAADRPNVILIMTDDQGYGDIAALGNEMIETPNMDAFCRRSTRLTNYHVDPTCSPTRSSLLTGRYSSRTGVWHTGMGRSLMHTDEVTLAELYRAAGYRTGIFGKWHLGDNYPLRPQDQGFDEVLIHGGGGVGQTPDHWGNDYFDDTYCHNGEWKQQEGYCTDVFFDGAMEFIDQCYQDDDPFFCYIATNTAHAPFNVAQEYSQPYLDKGVPQPMANFYGMITNIDENLGNLINAINEDGPSENTIVIFTTDNGTAAGVAHGEGEGWRGFNDGMRGMKVSEYDGGHRVPFFIRWPAGGLEEGRDIRPITAHIDILPTLVELCDIDLPEGVAIDGTSLVPLLRGEEEWPDRTLLIHTQRLETPEMWRRSTVMTDEWRLINGSELYNMVEDPGQQQNVAAEHADMVTLLRSEYEVWWESISTRFDDQVRISLGAAQQNPTLLTCHDWHRDSVPWTHEQVRREPNINGVWEVEIAEPGRYEFSLRMRPPGVDFPLSEGTARIVVGEIEQTEPIEKGSSEVVIGDIELPAGPTELQTWLPTSEGGTRGAYYIEVLRLE